MYIHDDFQVFVFLLSFLVTLQQALSSGYINSVITTIEKRFEIPSSLSGLIASSYEIGNVITVIFVSYLGSRRHIPVWIAIGTIFISLKNWLCKTLQSATIALHANWMSILLSSAFVFPFRCSDNGTGIDDLYGATFHSGTQLDDNRESFQFGQHLSRRIVTRARYGFR